MTPLLDHYCYYQRKAKYLYAKLVVILDVQHFFVTTTKLYSGDQNSEHLNSGNIWIKKFHLFAIQIPCYNLLFKPSVTKPISQTTYDLNNRPFKERTDLDHFNTELVRYSDPHCIKGLILIKCFVLQTWFWCRGSRSGEEMGQSMLEMPEQRSTWETQNLFR